MHVNPINQNILKIEKNYTFIHHETGCQDESVVFFYFQYVSHSTLVYRALYYGKIETLKHPINQNMYCKQEPDETLIIIRSE